MDDDCRPNEEEYAEAYKEWLWRRECDQQEDELERKLEAADLRRKELKEAA